MLCCAGFLAAVLSASGQNSSPSAPPSSPSGSAQPESGVAQPTPAQQTEIVPAAATPALAADANAARKKQLADEINVLLRPAVELKLAVDKTSKDELSLAVVRKAEEIEHHAHLLREKMKNAAGGEN
jgi:hypothetical protein